MARETTEREATIEDLLRVEGKAELVNGRIVTFMPTGDEPNFAASEIFVSLREHARRIGPGRAVSDNAGFLCELPHRRSFSPDAAYYTGPSGGMRFFPEPPDFAVEVRSEGDYGPAAEEQMEAKRADYFAAGTLIVWDVDLLGKESIVRKFAAPDAANPAASFSRGESADAEPAVPGWNIAVDKLFESQRNLRG
jgi:Uma2 family endonuclease